ncbi:hypothetical protein OIU78_017766 [Salix suchowensis]|nr:hypothetical protein OIU78_017766 [Salix suchowensis]
MVSLFAMHQQQLAMLAQQQLLMAAAAKTAGGNPKTANIGLTHPGGSSAPNPTSSLYNMGQVTPAANAGTTNGDGKTQSSSSVSSGGTSTETGKDYDFSLMQGMFSKH